MTTLGDRMQAIAMLVFGSRIANITTVGKVGIYRHTGAVAVIHNICRSATFGIDPVGKRSVGANGDILAGEVKNLHVGEGFVGTLIHA